MKTVLETPRLLLREVTLDDLDFVASMLADPEVMRFFPRCYTRDEAKEWVLRQPERYQKHGHGYWLTVEKATGEPVGQVGLLMLEVEGVEEGGLRYLIHSPFWRRGFATEAAAACRDYVLDSRGMKRVITLIRPENVPSQGVASKIGLKQERTTSFAGLEHLVFSLTRCGTP